MTTKPTKTKKLTKAEKLERERVERQAYFREIEGRMSMMLTDLHTAVSRRKTKSASPSKNQ